VHGRFPTLVISLVLIVTVAAQAGQGASVQTDRDLTEVVPAGEYRAYLVRLVEPGGIQWGGRYLGPTTDQPVLPILATLHAVDGGWSSGALFAYDFSIYNQQIGAEIGVKTAVIDVGGSTHAPGGTYGGGWATIFDAPAGDYRIVVGSAPANGNAEIRIRIPSSAIILASESGESIFVRGLDESLVGYDVHLWAAHPTGGVGPGALVRSWYYTGADIEIPVEGSLYGYVGYKWPTGAHWIDPSGGNVPRFVVGGAAGTWTASFPEERFTGPVCMMGSCHPSFGDSREDPPFAIAVDVGI
jgi:hypothetical protein